MHLRLARCSVSAFMLSLGIVCAVVLGNGAAFAQDRPLQADPLAPAQISASLKAPAGLYPNVVAVRTRNVGGDTPFSCSGVLLKPDWVLTQAYCIPANTSPNDVLVLSGHTDIAKARQTAVSQVIVHEFASTANRRPENSLALLKLAQPLPGKVAPVSTEAVAAIAARQGEAGGAVVAGWGKFFLSEPASSLHVQRHLAVRVATHEECRAALGDLYGAGMVCAHSAFREFDACEGFAGGPLLLADARGQFSVLGTVSWGIGCGGHPLAYTHIASYLSWIEVKIGPLDTAVAIPAAVRAAPQKSTLAPSARIVNPSANVAPTGLFRYMVSFAEAGKNQALGHFCGGSLVHRKWVLTAAHCVVAYQDKPEGLQLKLDSEILSRGGVFLKANRIIVHPEYAVKPEGNPAYDVALVEVSGDVPKDIAFPPLVEDAAEIELVGRSGELARDVVVVGWGKDAFSRFGKTSDYLHWTTLQMIPRADCNGAKSYAGRIDDSMYCAGKEDVDSCQGDSGGPLLAMDGNREFVLVGVVSWGEGCAKDNKPGVYVRLAKFRGWLADAMR